MSGGGFRTTVYARYTDFNGMSASLTRMNRELVVSGCADAVFFVARKLETDSFFEKAFPQGHVLERPLDDEGGGISETSIISQRLFCARPDNECHSSISFHIPVVPAFT